MSGSCSWTGGLRALCRPSVAELPKAHAPYRQISVFKFRIAVAVAPRYLQIGGVPNPVGEPNCCVTTALGSGRGVLTDAEDGPSSRAGWLPGRYSNVGRPWPTRFLDGMELRRELLPWNSMLQ